jgi:signal transduction histidine kinase
MGPASAGRAGDDLAVINHWLCVTRLRATAAVALFALVLQQLGITQVEVQPVLIVCGALAAFSLISLRSSIPTRTPRAFFYLQHVVDLSGITIGVGAAVTGLPALLFRSLFVMVIVPSSLVSVRAGLLVATVATAGHELLLALEHGGPSLATLGSAESLVPAFLFYLVAQQAFFYGGHLDGKNAALARLAERLEDSRGRLAALVDVARTLNSTLEAPTLLARMNRAALEWLGADWSATFLLDGERATYRLAATADAEGSADEARGVELPARGWDPIDRLHEERVVTFAGRDAEQTAEVLAPGRRLGSIRLAGLSRDGALVGVLAIGHRTAGALAHEATPQLLSGIAEHATIALRNAQLLEEARHASALKSEFVSTMSHELRTPLNVMIGYTEMLRDGAAGRLSREQRDLVERIDARSRELLELIEATLQVGRFEVGCGTVEVAPVPLRDLLDALEAGTAGLPRPPEVQLVWMPVMASGTVTTDRSKVALIVRNLVSNALKFTEEGTVTVWIAPQADRLLIEVTDTGIGIAPDQLPVIFDMFRQLDTAPTRRQGGVGLGLYIVKQFVDRLGGAVEVESVPGRGTRFRVVLPGYGQDAAGPSSRAA